MLHSHWILTHPRLHHPASCCVVKAWCGTIRHESMSHVRRRIEAFLSPTPDEASCRVMARRDVSRQDDRRAHRIDDFLAMRMPDLQMTSDGGRRHDRRDSEVAFAWSSAGMTIPAGKSPQHHFPEFMSVLFRFEDGRANPMTMMDDSFLGRWNARCV